MAKPAIVGLGAVLLAAGGAVASYGLTRKPTGGMTPQATEAMTSAVAQLDKVIGDARSAVTERAKTLAGLQAVQSAVVTDAATAKDMVVRGELAFTPDAGEVIELGIVKSGGRPEPLLIQPEGAMNSPHAGAPGSYAELMSDRVVVTEVREVVPKMTIEGLKAYVALSRPLDLKPAIEKLTTAGVAGVLHIGGQKRDIGSPPAGATTKEKDLLSTPGSKLVVAVPAMSGGMPMPLIAGGGAVAGLGFVLLILGFAAKRTRDESQPAAAARSAPGLAASLGSAATQLSATPITTPGAIASGTPSPVDSGPALSSASLGPGAMLGRWEIIKRLGSGGMADVYLARARGEAGFEKTVAVKVMHPHLARNERAVDHFLDEARLAATIHHPNVVAILDLGKIGNEYVIVMEHVDGVDLEKLLASARDGGRPVPIEIGLGIMRRICDGLTAAHRAIAKDGSPLRIIHRDVKSANVLVSTQGGVKVVDFGIAKAAQQNHQTMAGETKGTPSMMAPEQRVGEQVDVRADVYSTAAVAFEVLTGHGVNLDLAALAHLGVENWPHLPLPSSLRPQLPAELDAILLGSMAFERDKRAADCAALEEKLETVMKKYGLSVSDKDIARWVNSELKHVAPMSSEPTAVQTPA